MQIEDKKTPKNLYTYGKHDHEFVTDDGPSRPGTAESAATTTTAGSEENGLICEECERENATWRCKKCEEVFCDACLDVCHLPRRAKPHPHHQQRCIRRVKKGDTSSVRQRVVHNHPEERGVSEEEYNAMYVMPFPPSPREATDRHHHFRRGEYVLFIDPWEQRQAYGKVLVVPDARNGVTSHNIRRGEVHGELYSVEMVGLMTDLGSKGLERLIQNNDELDKEEGIQLVDESNRPIPTDLRFGQQQAKMTLQAKQRRWELSQRTDQAAPSNGLPSLKVCLLSVAVLYSPADKHLLLGADKFLPFRAYLEVHASAIERAAQLRAIAIWRQATEIIGEEQRQYAALCIQTRVRAWLCRNILSSLEADKAEMIRKKWEAVHAEFRYVKSPGGNDVGYSSDGRRFFAIQRDLNMYHFRRRKACATLSRILWRNAMIGFKCYFKHWREVTSVFTEAMIVGSHFNRQPDKKSLSHRLEVVDSPDYPFPHTYKGGILECIMTDTTAQLPRLPTTHVHQNPLGELLTEKPQRFNSFQARMKGPTDHSFWVVPGVICAGPYPAGNAVRAKSQLLVRHHPEAISQLMLGGVSTFVCLATDEEEANICNLHNQMLLEKEVEHRHQMAKGALKSLLSDYELQIQATANSLLRMQDYAHESDIRYKGVVEKKRLALLAQMRQLERVEQSLKTAAGNYPNVVHVVRKIIPSDGTIPIDKMLRLVQELERRILQGERLYVCSSRGHGRAGMVAACLLGRMYGLAAQDTLQRIQLYHDTCAIFRESPYKLSCPQTSQQRMMVEEVLSRSSVVPSGVIYRASPQADTFNDEWVVPVFGQSFSSEMVVKASGSRTHCAIPNISS